MGGLRSLALRVSVNAAASRQDWNSEVRAFLACPFLLL